MNSESNLTLRSAGFAAVGPITTLNGGNLSAPNGIALSASQTIVGNGTVNAKIAAQIGSTISATGNLALGDVASFSGFVSDGELYTNDHAVLLNDRDAAVLGALTVIGNSSGAGTLTAANGVLLSAGKTLTGYGIINGAFRNDGFVQGEGPSAGNQIDFASAVTGVGNFGGSVKFSDVYSPGNSAVEVALHDVELGSNAKLQIDLTGFQQGSQYDYLNASGMAVVGGTLAVNRAAGILPGLGTGFTIMTFASRSGTFSSYSGLGLDGKLVLKPLYRANSLVLQALPAIDGDINLDGTVNIFDINAVSSRWNTSDPLGDANGDGIVNIFDINLISSNWGASGSTSAVPEPSSLALATIGLLGLVGCIYRIRDQLATRTSPRMSKKDL